MPPVGFEPTISAGERAQTYALDRAATGTGGMYWYLPKISYEVKIFNFGYLLSGPPYLRQQRCQDP